MSTIAKKISDWKTLHPSVIPEWAKDLARVWFRLSAPLRAYPDFIIIGAPKCGTTSLFAYLSQHPEVIPSLEKETNYLRNGSFGSLAGYRSCFPLRGTLQRNACITGEGTTTYYYDREVIDRIEALPNSPKLFFMVREPAARAVSQYYHFRDRNSEQLDITEAFEYLLECYSGWELGQPLPEVDLTNVRSDYLRYGIYAHMFPHWAKFYKTQRLKVYEFSELIGSTSGVLDDACEYLGIGKMNVEARVFNKGSSRDKHTEILERLRTFYAPLNEGFFKLVGQRYDWD